MGGSHLRRRRSAAAGVRQAPAANLIVLRVLLIFGGLLLLGLGVAFLVTRNRRYLKMAWLAIQMMLLLGVGFALLYVFQRVLLI
jgi:hypothetical protein